MTDEPENIVLVYLRRLAEKMDRLIGDMQDLKHRVTSLELQGAHVQREMGGVDMAHMSQRWIVWRDG